MLPVMSDDEAEIRRTALVEGGELDPTRCDARGGHLATVGLLRQPLMCTAGRPEPPPAAGEPFKCLFNLDNDPKQLTNVARQNTEVVERLQARWDGYRATKAGKATPVSVGHDPEFKALLRRSGYFNASSPVVKDTPATFGGPGWRSRSSDHAADVAAGTLWRTVGVADEYSPLEAVLISAPSRRFAVNGDPEEHLMLNWPDLAQLEAEMEGDSGLL